MEMQMKRLKARKRDIAVITKIDGGEMPENAYAAE